MIIKIPSRIKIGGIVVTINYEDKLLDNHGKFAQSRFSEGEIVVQQRDMNDDFKTVCLFHELIHFLNKLYINDTIEEREIDALATGIHTLLVDLGIEFDWSNIKSINGNNKDENHISEV